MNKRILTSRQKFTQRLGAYVAIILFGLGTVYVAPIGVQAKQASINPNGQGKLLIVGDSLTIGANAFGALATKLRAEKVWSGVILDAKAGRRTSHGIQTISKRLQTTPNITALVVALGTNDMISRRETKYPRLVIDQLMTKVGQIPVLWVNVKFSPTGRADWRARGVRFNRELRKAQSRYPNLHIADWSTSFVPSGKSRYIVDGVHLTVSGYKTRAAWMQSQIITYGTNIINATTTTSTTIVDSTTTSVDSTTTTTTTDTPATTQGT